MARLVGGWGNEDWDGILHPLLAPFCDFTKSDLKNTKFMSNHKLIYLPVKLLFEWKLIKFMLKIHVNNLKIRENNV